MKLITDILTENASLYGCETALIEREPEKNLRREISWSGFDTYATELAAILQSLGVNRGSRVVQLMSNSLEWLPIYFGVLRTGAWVVPLNFRFDAAKIALCTQVAEAEVFLFGEEFIGRLEEVRKELNGQVKVWLFDGPERICPVWATHLKSLLDKDASVYTPVDIASKDTAALYFTSGTTGTPKAVRLTHGNLSFACEVEHAHHGQTHLDNFLCIPPLYHTGAKMHWFGNFKVGAKTVILKGVKPEYILRVASEEQVSIVWLLVPWAHDILIAIENGEVVLTDYNLDPWRLMHIGAQPVPPSLIDEWKKLFPHHAYDTNYGLTEASGPGCVHLGLENEHKVGAIGKPGHGWEAEVVDSKLTPLPGGETGELVVKGPGIMVEYYKNEAESGKCLSGGWLRTGDMARKDKDGFIWLVDRKKDLIISGGENIFPVEIEHHLMTHPDVQDVGIIGYPDSRLGEVVAAVVMVKEGRSISREAVGAFCESLPRYKRPRKIFFGVVPRNPTGKIEKPKLRRKYVRTNRDFRKLYE
ncbi:MAG: AMP-binding protein [Desulfobacterales bacterium]|nr:AMP-binding protein [Desulfobacterales bacterium]